MSRGRGGPFYRVRLLLAYVSLPSFLDFSLGSFLQCEVSLEVKMLCGSSWYSPVPLRICLCWWPLVPDIAA